MKQKILSQLLCCGLMLSFLLGVHEGRLALWKDQDPTPCKVFPCPVVVLPKAVQQQLKTGLRLETMDDVNSLLENFLS
jgi:hypothetical protein